jgi:Methyltransferase domain
VGLLDRLGSRKPETLRLQGPSAAADDPVFGTKALRKFLTSLTARESSVVLDLGPVVGSNVSFFGEQLGCKIFVEDIFSDLDRHARAGTLDALPEFLKTRLPQETGSVDGILCWDLFDYMDRQAATELATELTRVLRPDGALLAFFRATAQGQPNDSIYTKFIVADETNLKHRPYPAARGRQPVFVNRDIMRLFSGLRVSDSFLLQNNLREILFRKSA